jgi:tRNA threonylcarbamoyladenosine biosynthesis protein TsaE
MEVITKSAQETQSLGQKIGLDLKLGNLLALYGELGSGKTTFIQGLAKGLGIKKRILSPTFVFVRSYPLSPRGTFYHVDLYRINKVSEAIGLGLEEIFADPKAITVIEWAEKIKPILPKKRTEVFFEYQGENQRRIKIK